MSFRRADHLLFYRATAKLANEPSSEKKKDRNERMYIARHIASKTDEFNQKKEKNGYCFVSSIGKDDISCGMIFVNSCDVINCAKAFFEAIQIDYKDLNTEEITLSSFIIFWTEPTGQITSLTMIPYWSSSAWIQ